MGFSPTRLAKLSKLAISLTVYLSITTCSAGTFESDRSQYSAQRNRVRAFHFLCKATFGPTPEEVNQLALEMRRRGTRAACEQWIDSQFDLAPSRHVDTIQAMMNDHGLPPNSEDSIQRYRYHAFYHNAIAAPDQLRQRLAWALSQIFVVGDDQVIFVRENNPDGIPNWYGVSAYYDNFIGASDGNYRDLLEKVALHPAMGVYLSHLANRRAQPALNIFPDENFAREILQLFSIGLYELDTSGRLKTDANGNLIPTYDNTTIRNFARVFTGLNYSRAQYFGWGIPLDLVSPMEMWPQYHDTDAKELLNGVTLPVRAETVEDGMQDIKEALDNISSHPNVAPFICRLLIQRLTRSNPSTGYIRRVATVFNDTNGNWRDVVKAILLDPESFRSIRIRRLRSPWRISVTSRGTEYSRMQEPMLHYLSILRALQPEVTYNGSPSRWFMMRETDQVTGQSPFGSPSVFNFYSPNFQPPGAIRDTPGSRRLPDGRIYAPEFQIMTPIMINRKSNSLRYEMLEGGIEYVFWSATGNHIPGTIEFDFADWIDRMDEDIEGVVDELNWLFCGGTMMDSSRDAIIESFQEISAEQPWLDPSERFGAVIYFVVSTPECLVAE
ncbi:MAG: DUF1800 family protein [Planctomycetota bacterium]